MTPRISVIIPVYNVEEYILPCLQSVTEQTLTDGIECIIVDDCGCDNSIKFTEDFISRYKGNMVFELIRHERNKGLSAARNTGINAATGMFLFFLDSDDKITTNCLESMWTLTEKYPAVDMVQGIYCREENYNYFGMPEYTDDKRMIKPFLLRYEGDVVMAQNRLIRKDFLVRHHLYFKEGIIHEDNYWTFFLSKHVQSMAFCHEGTYYHINNPNSITGNLKVEKAIGAFRIIIEDASAHIDPFLPGHQKEWILYTLITSLNCHYYHTECERKQLVQVFARQNTLVERALLHAFLGMRDGSYRNKVLHLLIRLYKWKD